MAESIFLAGANGHVIRMDLPLHEAIADQFTRGHLRKVNEDGTPFVEEAPAAGDPPADQPPAHSALKPVWVGWAVRAHGVTPDEAEAMTKQDLIDKYDKPPAPPAE